MEYKVTEEIWWKLKEVLIDSKKRRLENVKRFPP